MAGHESNLSGTSFTTTVTALLLAMVALYFVDTFLAKTDQADSRVDAARFYASGQHLLQQGDGAQAVDRFRSAISEERTNQDYQLALAQALLAAGRSADAEATLNDLLQRNSAWGAANLEMARVLVREGRIDDGIVYYHRAIYGQWKNPPANAAGEGELQARFELTDLLSHQNSKAALLAELLPLQDEAPDDIATRNRLGNLFIAAGAPARAAVIFRDMLHRQPQGDAVAHAGLGEAEFALGNYRMAQTEFLTALRLRPDDPNTRKSLDLCNRVLDLDPARRGLTPEEQYQRSLTLVGLVLDDVNQCPGAAASEPARELIATVQDGLKKRVPAARRNAAFEDQLDWADRLWQVRKTECSRAITSTEQPLALVLSIPAR